MGASMLVMIREGFEAALIVAIVLAYLRRIERVDLMRPVWIGVGSAAALALAFGVGIHLSLGELTGPARLRAFTAISITAVIVLTWMVFWMKKRVSSRIRQGRALFRPMTPFRATAAIRLTFIARDRLQTAAVKPRSAL